MKIPNGFSEKLLAASVGGALALGAQAALMWRNLALHEYRIEQSTRLIAQIQEDQRKTAEIQATTVQQLKDLERRVGKTEDRTHTHGG